MTTCDEKGCAKDICVFLSDYSTRLLASGATCIRLDKNVTRIAGAFGMNVEMTIMPRHIHLSVIDKDSGDILTSIATVPDTGVNFTVNTELSRLSWEIADRKLNFSESLRKYESIISGTSHNKWLVNALVAVANASFCRLFSGDAAAMAVVAIATLAGYYMKTQLVSRKVDVRIVFIACSFISSVIGSSCLLFRFGDTPDIALATSILYLVPGIPFLNSFSDMLYGRYLCAFARFADATILTCCLTIGLCLATLLMNVSLF